MLLPDASDSPLFEEWADEKDKVDDVRGHAHHAEILQHEVEDVAEVEGAEVAKEAKIELPKSSNLFWFLLCLLPYLVYLQLRDELDAVEAGEEEDDGVSNQAVDGVRLDQPMVSG